MREHQPGKLLVVLFTLITAIISRPASAQAKKTATRSAEFDAFGGFTYVNTNYLPPYNNFGGTLGVDYTQFITSFKGLITPSFQIRGTLAPGSTVGERTLLGGIRVASTYKRLHPYVDALVGDGIVTFDHPATLAGGKLYSRDSTFVYDFGGGLTMDTKSNFSALVDYQYQYWDLDNHPPDRFYPYSLTFGVLYHIHPRPYR